VLFVLVLLLDLPALGVAVMPRRPVISPGGVTLLIEQSRDAGKRQGGEEAQYATPCAGVRQGLGQKIEAEAIHRSRLAFRRASSAAPQRSPVFTGVGCHGAAHDRWSVARQKQGAGH